jgi:glucokinase
MSGAPRWILGVDIGGTNVVVAAIPIEGGDPMALRKERTRPDRGAEDGVRRMAEMLEGTIADVLAEHGGSREDFAGVGIGCPGPLDRERGMVLETPNLGWVDFPLRDRISDAVGLPAVLDNDANCATYGEWWMGAGQGMDPLIGITLGTGIGGGIIMNGEIHHGASDAAGEVGHMTIAFAGRRCACGNYGCLEAYASGPAIAARAVEGLEAGAESLPGRIATRMMC